MTIGIWGKGNREKNNTVEEREKTNCERDLIGLLHLKDYYRDSVKSKIHKSVSSLFPVEKSDPLLDCHCTHSWLRVTFPSLLSFV